MMQIKKLVLICGLFVLSIHPSFANYVVDMVIFEHNSTDSWLEEYWPMLPLKLETTENDIELSPNITGFGWKWLNSGSAEMRSAEKKLTQSGNYHTLTKISWIQPTQNKNTGKIAVFETPNPDNGTSIQARVFIHKQKFEHIQLEVQLEKKIPNGVRELFALKSKQDISLLPSTWRFNLTEARKIKPGELNYFDHPQFGVLMLLTQLEAS